MEMDMDMEKSNRKYCKYSLMEKERERVIDRVTSRIGLRSIVDSGPFGKGFLKRIKSSGNGTEFTKVDG